MFNLTFSNKRDQGTLRACSACLFLAAPMLLFASATRAQAPIPPPPSAPAQTQSPTSAPPQTPASEVPPQTVPAPPQPSRQGYDYVYQAAVFAGTGAQISSGQSPASGQLGASVGLVGPNSYEGLSFEGGYLGPWSRLKSGSAIFSINWVTQWEARAGATFKPFATVGYTRLFGTGDAVNYGVGFDYHMSPSRAIRIEVRDYYSSAGPGGHDVALRIGLVGLGDD